MITCTFAGHREVFGSCTQKIENALETLIESEDTLYCYVGGMGEFDGFSAAVRNLKRKYPNKEIRLTLVLPYMQQKLNEYKEYYETSFDDILIPAELADIHYKRAIPARNRWLVDNSDYLIAMVWRDFGGAYTTLRYAQKQGKKIILLNDKKWGRGAGHRQPRPRVGKAFSASGRGKPVSENVLSVMACSLLTAAAASWRISSSM